MIALPGLPYPGLRAFGRDESLLFFGREGCVDDMLSTLAETRFLAVLGSSGSGKSSLVRTGLLNALERGLLVEAGSDWLIADFHPGAQPMRALAAALAPSASEAEIDALESLLGMGPRSLIEWTQFGSLKGRSLLLFVDQFEELFRYGEYAQREAAEAFVALLLESAASREAPIHVVLTMRSEFLGACSLVPDLAEQINRSLYLTPRMDRESCRQAIEGPARVFGFTIEPRLVNQILNDMASFAPFEGTREGNQVQLSRRADQLPLMQHLLNRLWTRARAANSGQVVLRFEDYEAVGGLAGAVDGHGAEVIAGLRPKARPEVETIFKALVSGPDPASATRRPARFDELAAEAGGAATARSIIDAFRTSDCNFLRPESHIPLEPDTVVDISHESLIRQWTLLADWTHEEALSDARWNRLVSGAERRRSGEGELLAGLDLMSLSSWWEKQKPSPAWAARHGGHYPEVEAFLTESRTAQEAAQTREANRAARERRRLIIFATCSSLLAVIAVSALVGLGLEGRTLLGTKAEIASARETAASLKAENLRVTTQNRDAVAQKDESLRNLGIMRHAADSAGAERKRAQAALKGASAKAASLEAEIRAREAVINDKTKQASDAEARLAAANNQLTLIAKRQKDDAKRQLEELKVMSRTTSMGARVLNYCQAPEQKNDPTCQMVLGLPRSSHK